MTVRDSLEVKPEPDHLIQSGKETMLSGNPRYNLDHTNVTGYGFYSIEVMFDNWTDVAEHKATLTSLQVTGQIFVIVTIMILAILGNIIMICAVIKTPYLRTVTNLFTLNLAVTDLGIAGLVLPMWMVTTVMGNSALVSPFPYPLCHVIAFTTVLLLLVSIATLAGISLDRYFSICHPLRYPIEVTPNRVYSTIVYIWFQSAILSTTPIIGWGRYTFRPQTLAICSPEWTQNISYALFLVTVGLLIPFSLMIFSYVRIIQEARKQAKRMEDIQLKLVMPSDYNKTQPTTPESDQISKGSPQPRRLSMLQRWRRKSLGQGQVVKSYSALSRNLKTLKTVFIVVGAFFVCWGPYVLVNTWAANNHSMSMPYDAEVVTTIFAFANCAVNPFVFISLTRDFRFAVRVLLLRCLDCMGHKEALQGYNSRRSSFQIESVVEAIRASRASFDSGVEMDRENGSSRMSLAPSSIPRHGSCVTICSTSIDSDEDNAEMEPITSPTKQMNSYGSLDVSDASKSPNSHSKSHSSFVKAQFVPQYGSTLKPPDRMDSFLEKTALRRCNAANNSNKLASLEKGSIQLNDIHRNGNKECDSIADNGELKSGQMYGNINIPILVFTDEEDD